MPADMLRLGGSTIFELHEQLNTKEREWSIIVRRIYIKRKPTTLYILNRLSKLKKKAKTRQSKNNNNLNQKVINTSEED